jgi:hypothetical protein
MTFHSIAIRSVIVVASLLAAPSARAECVWLSAKDVMEGKLYELVFSGTVMEITRTADFGYRATFYVDRVWKGSVAKRFDLYVWELPAETPHFEIGQHYVALAKRLTDPRARQSAGVVGADTVAFAPVECSDAQGPNLIRDLGAGQPPK